MTIRRLLFQWIERVDGWGIGAVNCLVQFTYDWLDLGWTELFQINGLLLVLAMTMEHIQYGKSWVAVPVLVFSCSMVLFCVFIATMLRTKIELLPGTTGAVVRVFLSLLYLHYAIREGIEAKFFPVLDDICWIFYFYLTADSEEPKGPSGGKRKQLLEKLKQSTWLPESDGVRA